MGLYRNGGQESSLKKNDQSESLLDSIKSAEGMGVWRWGMEPWGRAQISEFGNLSNPILIFFYLWSLLRVIIFLGKWCWPDTIITASPKNWLD